MNQTEYNFKEYIQWVFNENGGTLGPQKQQNNQQESQIETQKQSQIKFKSCLILSKEDQDNLIWVFRQCQTMEEQQKQSDILIKLKYIIRHIIQFILLLIKDIKQSSTLVILLKSIGMRINEQKQQLTLIIDDDISSNLEVIELLNKIKYTHAQIIKSEEVKYQTVEQFIKAWAEIKESNFQLGLQQFILKQNSIEQTTKEIIIKENQKQNISQTEQQIKEQITQKISKDQNLNPIYYLLEQFSQINYNLSKQNQENLKRLQKQIEAQILQRKKEKEDKIKKQASQVLKQKPLKLIFCRVKTTLNNSKQLRMLPLNNSKQLRMLPNGNIIYGSQFVEQNYKLPYLNIDFQSKLYGQLRSQYLFLNMINQQFQQQQQQQQQLNETAFYEYIGQLDQFNLPYTNNSGLVKFFDFQNQYNYNGFFKNGLFHMKGELFFNKQKIFCGQFQNGVKHGNGIEFFIYQNNNYYIEGQFISNKKQGQFQIQNSNQSLYFQNDQLVNMNIDNKFSCNYSPTIQIYYNNNYTLSNYQLNSLRPGAWLNASILDIYLQEILNLEIQLKPYQKGLFVNCSQCQDIFGSIISNDSDINQDVFNNLLQEFLDQQKFNKRTKIGKAFQEKIIFYLNLDRSHFLTVAYEENQLYLIDSLQNQRNCLLQKIKCLLEKAPLIKANNIQINCLDVSMQQNGYDCGAYTCYYVSQIMKNIEQKIKTINQEWKLSVKNQQQINKFRFDIYQRFLGYN